MFVLIGLLFGIISAFVAAYVHFLLLKWTDWILVDTTFFFILPVGGFFFGALGSAGVFISNIMGASRKRWVFPSACVGAFTGLLTIYLIWSYMYWDSGYDQFGDYLHDLLATSKTEIFLKHEHEHFHGDLGEIPLLALLSFIVQPIGAFIAGLAIGAGVPNEANI